MAVEHIHLVKRTIYVAQCKCGERSERAENPPRETLCKCGRWVKYEATSYTGPELSK